MKYQDFPFTKTSYLHRAQWRYYFYLSRVRILVSPYVTNMISQLQESFPLRRAAGSFEILEFWLFGTENISIAVYISSL